MNPIEMLQRACEQAEPQVAAAAANPEAQTTCTEWTAAQLAAHMVNSLRFNTELISGQTPTTNPFQSPEIAPDALLQEFKTAAAGLVEAANGPGVLEAIIQHPAGEMPGAAALMFPTFDTYVHAWDLEQANQLGQEFPADMTAAIDGFCQNAFSGERNPEVVAEAVEAPADADAMGKLGAFLGRSV